MQITDNTKLQAVEQFNSHELENCLATSNKAEYKLWPSNFISREIFTKNAHTQVLKTQIFNEALLVMPKLGCNLWNIHIMYTIYSRDQSIFPCKGSDSKYFRVCRPYGLCFLLQLLNSTFGVEKQPQIVCKRNGVAVFNKTIYKNRQFACYTVMNINEL